MMALGGRVRALLRAENHLSHAFAVAQVYENTATMVTTRIDPSAKVRFARYARRAFRCNEWVR